MRFPPQQTSSVPCSLCCNSNYVCMFSFFFSLLCSLLRRVLKESSKQPDGTHPVPHLHGTNPTRDILVTARLRKVTFPPSLLDTLTTASFGVQRRDLILKRLWAGNSFKQADVAHQIHVAYCNRNLTRVIFKERSTPQPRNKRKTLV